MSGIFYLPISEEMVLARFLRTDVAQDPGTADCALDRKFHDVQNVTAQLPLVRMTKTYLSLRVFTLLKPSFRDWAAVAIEMLFLLIDRPHTAEASRQPCCTLYHLVAAQESSAASKWLAVTQPASFCTFQNFLLLSLSHLERLYSKSEHTCK